MQHEGKGIQKQNSNQYVQIILCSHRLHSNLVGQFTITLQLVDIDQVVA